MASSLQHVAAESSFRDSAVAGASVADSVAFDLAVVVAASGSIPEASDSDFAEVSDSVETFGSDFAQPFGSDSAEASGFAEVSAGIPNL